MNILRQQDILKGVPDQRLMQEMQSPSGSVPQFLVMSEMQRRKGMRDEFTSRQESPSTVAEDLVGVEKAQAGLGPQPLGVGQSPTTIQAGLPQPAQPVMMESGGVVKYQEGTEGLTVLSDDELIAMYRSIDPDGKLNGSSRDADEVLMEVEDRELDFSMQLDPSRGSVSLPNQRMTQEDRPPAPGFMQQILNKVSGKDPDNPFTGNLPPSSSGSVEMPRSLIRDNQPPNVEIPPVPNVQSDTIVQRLLERQGAPDTRRVLGRTEPNQDPVPLDNNKFAGIGKIFDTSSLINRRQEQEPPIEIGLPYSDEGLGGRDNLYRNLSDTYDRYNRRLSRNRVEEPTQVEGPPVPNVQSDTIIQRLLERQLPAGPPTSPKLPPDSNQPQMLSNNIGDYYPGRTSPASLDNIKGYLSSIGDYITSRAAPVVEGSPEDLLQKYQEGEEIRKAYADMDVGMGPVVNQAGSVVNPFPGAVSPQEQARLNNIKLLSKTPTPAPNNPVVAEAPPASPAVVSPVVFGSDQEAINRAGGVASSGEFDIRSDDAGLNVTKEQNKVAKKIQENPALAYEKMRKDGISDAQAMGLIMAGLGIMEAASQPGATALGSLSGAKAGVQQYSKDLQALNERIEKRRLADEDKRYKERRLGQEDRKIDINLKTATAAKINAEINRIKANQPPEAIRTINAILAEKDLAKKKQMVEMYNRRYGRAPGDPYRDIKTINTLNKAFAAELRTDLTKQSKLRAMAKQIAKSNKRKSPSAADKEQAREQMRRLFFIGSNAPDLFSPQAGGGAPTTTGPRAASLESFNKKE